MGNFRACSAKWILNNKQKNGRKRLIKINRKYVLMSHNISSTWIIQDRGIKRDKIRAQTFFTTFLQCHHTVLEESIGAGKDSLLNSPTFIVCLASLKKENWNILQGQTFSSILLSKSESRINEKLSAKLIFCLIFGSMLCFNFKNSTLRSY